MGKKVKKKSRAPIKEKRVATHSQKTVPQQANSSTETVADGASVVKERTTCIHLEKGVDLSKLSAKVGSSEPITCEVCRFAGKGGKGKGKHGKKKDGAALDPKSDLRAIWICLKCGHYACGGVGLPTSHQGHVVQHVRQTCHPLVIQFEKPLCWCFTCNILVPMEKNEHKNVLFDVVKLIKGRSSNQSSVDVEDVGFGDGSVTSEIKAVSSVLSDSDVGDSYVVRGLVNLGNTCFFNSIMQNLLAMGALRDYFFKFEASSGSLTIALKKLFIETKPEAGLKNVINPRSFFGCVCSKAPQFRGYQQHDSHELLRCLLDGLSTEEVGARKQKNSSDGDGFSSNLITFVDTVFGGQISSTVCCIECGYASTVYEPFLDLSLPVPTKKPPSKKVQPVSRAKKTKLPSKKVGKTRPKAKKDAGLLPVQSFSTPSPSNDISCQPQAVEPMAEKAMSSLCDSTPLGSNGQVIVAAEGDSTSQNFLAVQTSVNEKVFENAVEQTSAVLNDFTWLDFLDPGTIPDQHNLISQSNGISATQDPEKNEQVFENAVVQTSASLDNFSRLDYLDPGSTPDDHEQRNSVSSTQDPKKKDVYLNDVPLPADSGSSSQIPSVNVEPNPKSNSSGNYWEDELPLQVQDNEVLLLPYKEESSTVGEMKGEAEAFLSVGGYGQDELDIDGFGDMFNEPEVVMGPAPRPSSENVAAETSVLAGNSSESDPGEVDDSDSPVTVDSCLAHFIKPELLSNENAWHCESCSKTVQHQRLRSKKQGKTASTVLLNGDETRGQNEHVSLDKDLLCAAEVRNLTNGDIKIDASVDNAGEILVAPKEINDCPKIENGITGDQNSVVSKWEDGTSEIEDAVPEQSHSSGCYKTCVQSIDSCTVHELSHMQKVQHSNSLLLAGGHESEGSEDEEMDSKSVKVKRDATKRVLIYKAPPILTIHLKRFSQDARGRLSKLNGHVSFRETIDLRSYMDPRCVDKEKYHYHLVGVVEHSGTMRGGHYVAYVRGGEKSRGKAQQETGGSVWYHASDAYVREASLEEVLRSEAYILFYEKL